MDRTFTGGSGQDTFNITLLANDEGLDEPAEIAEITDFVPGEDTLNLNAFGETIGGGGYFHNKQFNNMEIVEVNEGADTEVQLTFDTTTFFGEYREFINEYGEWDAEPILYYGTSSYSLLLKNVTGLTMDDINLET